MEGPEKELENFDASTLHVCKLVVSADVVLSCAVALH